MFTGAYSSGAPLVPVLVLTITASSHRRQHEFEDAALEWLDRRHVEEAEGGIGLSPRSDIGRS